MRYIGNTEGGTAYAMVMGVGQYTDYTFRLPFTIAPSRDCSGFYLHQPANRVYTGKEKHKPSSITVKDASGKTLKNGLDYTWTVSNAVEVGDSDGTRADDGKLCRNLRDDLSDHEECTEHYHRRPQDGSAAGGCAI